MKKRKEIEEVNKSTWKKKRKGFSGVRRNNVVTEANVCRQLRLMYVDNEQQTQEGTSDASSNQRYASYSSEILLPAPALFWPDIVSVMQSK